MIASPPPIVTLSYGHDSVFIAVDHPSVPLIPAKAKGYPRSTKFYARRIDRWDGPLRHR